MHSLQLTSCSASVSAALDDWLRISRHILLGLETLAQLTRLSITCMNMSAVLFINKSGRWRRAHSFVLSQAKAKPPRNKTKILELSAEVSIITWMQIGLFPCISSAISKTQLGFLPQNKTVKSVSATRNSCKYCCSWVGQIMLLYITSPVNPPLSCTAKTNLLSCFHTYVYGLKEPSAHVHVSPDVDCVPVQYT